MKASSTTHTLALSVLSHTRLIAHTLCLWLQSYLTSVDIIRNDKLRWSLVCNDGCLGENPKDFRTELRFPETSHAERVVEVTHVFYLTGGIPSYMKRFCSSGFAYMYGARIRPCLRRYPVNAV